MLDAAELHSDLYADMTARVALRTAALAWAPLAPGVEVKLLERARPRLTALFRLAPGAVLGVHEDHACRDALVLEGDLGGHRRATYLHHTAGAAFELASRHGCVVLVKLRPAGSGASRVVDTAALPWHPASTRGVAVRELHADGDARVVQLRFAAGAAIASHRHERGEEFFVLDGELCDEVDRYPAHCWVRQPAGSIHSVVSPQGCTLYTISGHLARP